MQPRLILFALLSWGWMSHAARAEENAYPELTEFVRSEVENMTVALNAVPENPIWDQPLDDGQPWYFKRFFLRVQAKAGFEVTAIAKVELIPEIELVWQREKAEGKL